MHQMHPNPPGQPSTSPDEQEPPRPNGVPECAPHGTSTQLPADIRQMFHELQSNQLALQAQNETLRQTQLELDAARQRYFDLYDTAPVGYCTISNKGVILEANLTAAQLLDIPRNQLILRPLRDFVHQEDQEILTHHCRKHFANPGPQICELRMTRGQGTTFWAQLVTTTDHMREQFSECRLVISDISALKQAEKALRQSEESARGAKKLLQLVLDTIPVRLFWKDLNSTFLGCNVLFAQDAGRTVPEELIGLNDFDMAWREQAEMYRRDDLEVMQSGQPKLHYEEVQTTPEGHQIWLSTTKVPLRDADDNIIGILGTYEDISQRKWAEAELLKARNLESLGLLAGGMAHDFNNILMVILGNITFAKMLSPQKSRINELLAAAETASMKAKDLTRRFLTFSKGGAPMKHSLATAQLVKSFGLFALSGTKSACAYTFPENLWNIDADEGLIGQALVNILINADQAMDAGGTVWIEGKNVTIRQDDTIPLPPGPYVKIMIRDQGTGIPSENLGKIFDPYFTTKGGSHGLGLASAHAIINKHGGHIGVQSKKGRGTTIILHLPASAEQTVFSRTGPRKKETEIIQGHGKILVMDDDAAVLKTISQMLTELGYQVELAENGAEALSKYAEALPSQAPFDVVIMDLTVAGGMGGQEAMKHLLALDPHIKAIISSGYSNDPVMAEYRKHGFCDVIAKPYRLEDLSQRLHQVLA